MRLTRPLKILMASAMVVIVLGIGLYFWARSVLTGDRVRETVAAQLTSALGQPVTIGSLGFSIFPRVTMDLTDVAIGKPARITVKQLHVGTPFWALLSRRIENADFTLDGGRIQLPLPPLGGTKTPGEPAGEPPVKIVSIDEIRLKDVEVTSGGRTVRADASLALRGAGLTVSRLAVTAGATSVNVTGDISDLSGPTGKLAIRASGLDVPALAAFLDDFSSGAGLGAGPGGGKSKSAMNLAISLDADRAAFGELAVTSLSGLARVTPDAITIDPIRFGLFSGLYDGTMRLTLGDVPAFRLKAKVAKVNVDEIMTFTGNPGVMTGTAAATLDVSGRGTTAERVIASTTGTTRIDVTDGTVARLGLVRTVIVATSGRSGASAGSGAGSEKFSKLGATFEIGNGVARTGDMRFESPDVLLAAVGTVRLDGQNVELSGPLQLSEALSQQAGRDLVRYTAQDGRVTVPVTVEGPVDNLKVGVGLTDLARRAVTNKATEEIKKGILSGLKKIIKKN
jgi:uncharacterized protein involved in outer membrane biogenesis